MWRTLNTASPSHGCHGSGVVSSSLILHGKLFRLLLERVYPGCVRVQHRAGFRIHQGVVGARAGLQPHAAHEPVLLQPYRPRQFRPTAVGAVPVVVHVPQPILGREESLGKEGVLHRRSLGVWNAVNVAIDAHGSIQPRHFYGLARFGHRPLQVGSAYHRLTPIVFIQLLYLDDVEAATCSQPLSGFPA